MTKNKSEKQDKIEVINLLILAVISCGVGFSLVYFLFKPDQDPTAQTENIELTNTHSPPPAAELPTAGQPTIQPAHNGPQPSGGGYAPVGSGSGFDSTVKSTAPAPNEHQGLEPAQATPEPSAGSAIKAVPPGRTPTGVSIDGDAFYLKCWDSAGVEHAGDACGRLRVLEKRFSTRLYVVDRCKRKHAAAAKGKLSLGVEVDFAAQSIRFWNGASSSLKNAGEVGSCIRGDLAGLPIQEISHKYDRYRLFFTVLFDEAKPAAKPAPAAEAQRPAAKAGGRDVNVVKDHVRVRRAPVDGSIIGKISSGNTVKFLRKKGDWCNIVTPNGNNGWMICDALNL